MSYQIFESIVKKKLGSEEDFEDMGEDEKELWAKMISGMVNTMLLIKDV